MDLRLALKMLVWEIIVVLKQVGPVRHMKGLGVGVEVL